MVVGVASYFFEVVVLSADADTFLCVSDSGIIPLAGSEEDFFELIHPGVREEERRVAVRYDGSARNDAMLPGGEKIEERLSDFP